MSSKKSRFKVLANIPVRRNKNIIQNTELNEIKKEAADGNNEQLPNQSKNVSPLAPKEINLAEQAKNCIVPSAEIVKQDASDGNISSSNSIEKSSFRRIKPIVCLPIKKQKPRDETIVTESSNEILHTDSTPQNVVPTSPPRQEQTFQNSSLIDLCHRDLNVVENINVPEVAEAATITQFTHDSSTSEPNISVNILSPLKSPIKPRFVRPAIRDLTLRRQSAHASSASESEDDSKRVNISEKCMKRNGNLDTSLATLPANSIQSTSETDLDTNEFARMAMMKKRKKPKVGHFVRKIAEARREFNKKFENKKPDRSSLTMFDLIYYNPRSNPINSEKDGQPPRPENKFSKNEKEKLLEEENADDPNVPAEEEGSDEDEELSMPVPQVKIGANGEIILDEKSLVIETTEAKKGRKALMNSVPVFEDGGRKVSYYGRRTNKMKDWSPLETMCFYKALNSIGTDFALMQPLFPDRSRGQLKNKFKREERLNPNLVEKALCEPAEFNIELLKEKLDRHRKQVAEETQKRHEEELKADKDRKERKAEKKVSVPLSSPIPSTYDSVDVPEIIDIKPKKSGRPVRLAAQRRKLSHDFVDPNDIDDGAIDLNRETSRKRRRITVYSPVQDIEVATNDGDSVISEEQTESITNNEFISLLQQNIENLQQSTIRVHVPRPGIDGAQIQIVLDQEPGCDMRERSSPFPVSTKPKANAIKRYEDENIEINSSQLVNTLANVEISPNVHDGVVQSNVTPKSNENSAYSSNSSASILPTYTALGSENKQGWHNNIEGVGFPTNVLYADHPYSLDQNYEYRFNEERIQGRQEDIEYETQSSGYQGETNLDDSQNLLKPIYDETALKAPTEQSMRFKSCGGFEYVVVEGGSDNPDKKTYLGGLKAGSFVFMATEGINTPLEQRCSMSMIVEKVDDYGNKILTPMPVVLPPDLMNMIVSELECS